MELTEACVEESGAGCWTVAIGSEANGPGRRGRMYEVFGILSEDFGDDMDLRGWMHTMQRKGCWTVSVRE